MTVPSFQVAAGEPRHAQPGVIEVPFTITLERSGVAPESRSSTATLVRDRLRERWVRLSAAHPQHWIGWDFADELESVFGPAGPALDAMLGEIERVCSLAIKNWKP